MNYSIHTKKMRTEWGQPVRYQLQWQEGLIDMNELVGKQVALSFFGKIECIVCGRNTKKAFGQGFCYPCFMNAPQNAPCIIRPELCEAHLEDQPSSRDMEWEKRHHNTTHHVYLAQSSGLKVGVTRGDQIPTRWIDQGAWKAVIFATVPYRRLAGEIEVALKEHIADKTHWQRMLKNELNADLQLDDEKWRIAELLPSPLQEFIDDEGKVLEIEYPVLAYPTKVKSINLDKTPEFEGQLMGIKGQYLIFEGGLVINLRKYSGYHIDIGVE